MLNRKLNEYIFYGVLVAIALVIVLIRVVVVGGQDTRINDITNENQQLQDEIDRLSLLVQENRDAQTSQLYELYYRIPNIYSTEALQFKTTAMLEELGVDDSQDFNRDIDIYTTVNVNPNSAIGLGTVGYTLVQVVVTFTTNDITYVTNLIDEIINNEQLFILDTLDYTDTVSDIGLPMTISFYAVYDIEPLPSANNN